MNVQRSYRDGDETKYATNFTLAAALPAAIRTLQLAQAHVEEHEAKVASSNGKGDF